MWYLEQWNRPQNLMETERELLLEFWLSLGPTVRRGFAQKWLAMPTWHTEALRASRKKPEGFEMR
jgi:hypothetical protein